VAVWGPGGAPGRSTVALSLASSAAARGIDTVLVDADTHGGALGQMLSVLDDVSGLVAACRAVNNGRAGEVVDHLLEVDPSLRLLTGVPRADMWSQVRTSAMRGVLDELSTHSGLVVADVGAPIESAAGPGPSRDQTTVQVLESADAVLVVGRPDPVGLSRLVRAVHDLAALVPEVRPVVVVNMMRSTLGWHEREVRATVLRLTGTEPVVHLPHDQSGLDLAAMSGRSPREAAPSSPFVARVEVLTSHVLELVVSTDALAGSHR
jgi:MinD-like ATPase involved in chromosome partitioning or flagellar assembly